MTYGRLTIGEEKPVIIGVKSNILGRVEDFLSWNVYAGKVFTDEPAYMLLWKKTGIVIYRNLLLTAFRGC